MSALTDLHDYQAAVAARRVARPGTTIFKVAEQTIDEVGPVQYDVPVECLLCRNKYPLTTTIAAMAEWKDAPRGICKTCDGEVEITLVGV